MTELQRIADKTADLARRQWAARHFIVQQIANELADVSALLDELDEEWEAIERMAERIRHQCRRLDHKHSSETLDIDDRQKLFRHTDG